MRQTQTYLPHICLQSLPLHCVLKHKVTHFGQTRYTISKTRQLKKRAS
jgi:hypothetical protein